MRRPLFTLQHYGIISPFYHIVPQAIYLPSLVIAILATIIASQALISGCFTLINEAIRLDIWPRHRVLFPGNSVTLTMLKDAELRMR